MSSDRYRYTARVFSDSRRAVAAKFVATLVAVEAAMGAAHLQGCGNSFTSEGIGGAGGSAPAGGQAGVAGNGGVAGTTSGGNGGVSGGAGAGGIAGQAGSSAGGAGGVAGHGGEAGTAGFGGAGGEAGFGGQGGAGGSPGEVCSGVSNQTLQQWYNLNSPVNVGGYMFTYKGPSGSDIAIFDVTCGDGGAVIASGVEVQVGVEKTIDRQVDGKQIRVNLTTRNAASAYATITVEPI